MDNSNQTIYTITVLWHPPRQKT